MSRKGKIAATGESELESTYKTKVKYHCPKRGWVEEEVEVKRYKAAKPQEGSRFDNEVVELLKSIKITDDEDQAEELENEGMSVVEPEEL